MKQEKREEGKISTMIINTTDCPTNLNLYSVRKWRLKHRNNFFFKDGNTNLKSKIVQNKMSLRDWGIRLKKKKTIAVLVLFNAVD